MTHSMTFFLLLVGHALADFPLQGDFLARFKSRYETDAIGIWPWALFWHGMIQAGFVILITGSVWLALAELVSHIVIDFLKCEDRITFGQDQVLHVLFKCLWMVFILAGRAVSA